jgi:uncharacterized membrane protein
MCETAPELDSVFVFTYQSLFDRALGVQIANENNRPGKQVAANLAMGAVLGGVVGAVGGAGLGAAIGGSVGATLPARRN